MSFLKSLKAMFGDKKETKAECCDHDQPEMTQEECCQDDKCGCAENACEDKTMCAPEGCSTEKCCKPEAK